MANTTRRGESERRPGTPPTCAPFHTGCSFRCCDRVSGFAVDRFFTANNLLNILMQSSALGFMAIGMTAVLLTGGIDLSIPAIMAFAGILGSMYMREGGNPLIAAAIMIGAGVAGGALNGFAVAF